MRLPELYIILIKACMYPHRWYSGTVVNVESFQRITM